MSRKAELQVMMLTQALGVATHSDLMLWIPLASNPVQRAVHPQILWWATAWLTTPSGLWQRSQRQLGFGEPALRHDSLLEPALGAQ